MATKAELQQRQESNEQLRLECLAGFSVVINHPICNAAIELASEMLIDRLDCDPSSADLINQLGRSLGSIAANFAEGLGRSTMQDKVRFLRMARGSAYESIVHARILMVDGSDFTSRVANLAQELDDYIITVIA